MSSNKKARVDNNGYVEFVEFKEFNFTWTVPDFNNWFSQNDGNIWSPLCPSIECREMQWKLLFKRESKLDKLYCSLYLSLKKCPKQQVKVKYGFSMMDDHKTILCQTANSVHVFRQGQSVGIPNFIRRKFLIASMAAGNKLIITCQFLLKVEILDEVKPARSLAADLATLLGDKNFGDVSVKIGDRMIPVHKSILVARSSVFAAMFESTMLESTTNVVIVDDIKANVFDELLRYIYTDKVNSLDTMAFELYAAADKYDLQGLMSLCRMHILANLSAENVVESLISADLHRDNVMKKQALLFLSENRRAAVGVTKTSGWNQLLGTHPHLVTEAFQALANKV